MRHFAVATHPPAAAAGISSPLDIAGCVTWHDASVAGDFTFSAGTTVSQWNDKSTRAKHLTQATNGVRPERTGTQNSLSTVVFTADWMGAAAAADWPFLNDTTAHTIFAVFKPGTTSDPNALYPILSTSALSVASRGMALVWDDRASSSRNERINHYISNGTSAICVNLTGDAFAAANTWHCVSVAVDANNGTAASRSALRRNGGTAVTNNSTSGTPSASNPIAAFRLGALSDASFIFTGEIAEIVIYNVTLTSPERASVETYLMTKWGL